MDQTYSTETIRRLIDGDLDWNELKRIMSRPKDKERFVTYIGILQERSAWPDRILLPLGERLFIVVTESGERRVKCECGFEFCRPEENWKLHAAIYVRDTAEALEEIYPGPRAPDPDYMELREFYCPGCGAQLEVEAVTPGYPIVFEFEPDIDVFYHEWLGIPVPDGAP